ncbi:hypothetical protein MRX96_057899 [Rhipicephalus microplus]
MIAAYDGTRTIGERGMHQSRKVGIEKSAVQIKKYTKKRKKACENSREWKGPAGSSRERQPREGATGRGGGANREEDGMISGRRLPREETLKRRARVEEDKWGCLLRSRAKLVHAD